MSLGGESQDFWVIGSDPGLETDATQLLIQSHKKHFQTIITDRTFSGTHLRRRLEENILSLDSCSQISVCYARNEKSFFYLVIVPSDDTRELEYH